MQTKRPLKHKYKKTGGWMRAELEALGYEPKQLKATDGNLQKILEGHGYSFGGEIKQATIAR